MKQKNKIKILQLGKFYPPMFGGIQNVMYEITTGLNAQQIQCDVLCSNDTNRYVVEKYNTYYVYRTKSYGIYFSTSITPQMIQKLKEIQDNYDVISIHFPDPMAALALFLAKPKAKIVLHWHSDIIKQKYLLKLFSPLQNWVIQRADKIVGATPNHIEASQYAKLLRPKSIIIPYPFDTQKLLSTIDYTLLQKLKRKYKNKKIIFSMGRLVYYKGFTKLINAAKYLDDNYIILIGGDGVLKTSLSQQIQKNNLEKKVELLGFIPDNILGTYYALCDIFCLSSTYKSEMFGIVQLEAMSFGKPVISSKIEHSGVCTVNQDQVTGRCINISNPTELSLALKEICENKNNYQRISQNCLHHVSTIYDKKLVIKQYIQLYQNLAS